MRYYSIEPEVAGGHGRGTVYDYAVTPAAVSRLHYEFSDWLGDSLLESAPCFIATVDLSRQIEQIGLTGVTFDEVETSLSPEGEELIDHPLPEWRWMKVIGSPGESDFYLDDSATLIISERALEVLRMAGIDNADIESL
ncbi:hypothetical protein [Nocardia sp. CC227C]|uniref:hypothetical protein n=1 Tax=Nocardia sp. CC227C TaxID=3044562 RepID=UPI00278C6AEE|nr:hypothetical protein [Nocardia sp. CC227C]